MGWKRYAKKAAKIAGYTPFTGFGLLNEASGLNTGTPAGSVAGMLGIETPGMKREAKEAAARTEAEAAAAARQAEFEASAKAGLERLALRRRRSYASSILVYPGSSLSSGSTLGA
jgi:hypothetical protein